MIINNVPFTGLQHAEATWTVAVGMPIIVRAATTNDNDVFLDFSDVNASLVAAMAMLLLLLQKAVPSSNAAAYLTPHMPASNTWLGLAAFPQIDDGSIVNKALEDLLQALVMVDYEAAVMPWSLEWSMRWASFNVMKGKQRLFQAQVDGIFANVNGDAVRGTRKLSRLIIEVKTYLCHDEYDIRYQEAVQMVVWISSEYSNDNAAGEDGFYRSVTSSSGFHDLHPIPRIDSKPLTPHLLSIHSAASLYKLVIKLHLGCGS